MKPNPDTAPSTKRPTSLSLDYRLIVGILIAIIIAMILVWRPWEPRLSAQSRTIEVTGEATLKATPDEYVFYPSYNFENSDATAALAAVKTKSSELVAGLKKLGIADSDIKTNTNGYDKQGVSLEQLKRVQPSSSSSVYTLQFTITVNNRELVQKVQDYLLTTGPSGIVSPQASFSTKKQKELESTARDTATKEARTKAEQSGKNLGFSLGPVKSVKDDAGFDGVFPLLQEGDAASDTSSTDSLSVQPGENELTYRVTVVYYLK